MKEEKYLINNQPISKINWIDARILIANDYNPNVVLSQELGLLKFSLLKTGWIQPILVSIYNVIIDGFHRFWLSTNDQDVINAFNYQVPVCVLNLNPSERKLLTVRINRAKGNHIAAKMAELVKSVYDEGMPVEQIAASIGATEGEVNLLLQDDVFDKLNIKQYEYSQAWQVKTK